MVILVSMVMSVMILVFLIILESLINTVINLLNMVILLIVFSPGILVNMLICVDLVIVGNRLILKNLRSWSKM